MMYDKDTRVVLDLMQIYWHANIVSNGCKKLCIPMMWDLL